MKIITQPQDLQIWRRTQSAGLIGFVPTMGALHAGHIRLVQRSKSECNTTVTSIFVNPLQFGPQEDLQRYPRPLESDLRLLEEAGVDVVFLPEPGQLTPTQATTSVSEEKLSTELCGQFRPGHFRGVTTIVAKLFNLVQPDIAYFGQKDAQQCAVIERMVEDLNFPVRIQRVETLREPDGLALSSRNTYLTPSEREKASLIYRSFRDVEAALRQGQSNVAALIEIGKKVLTESGAFAIQYYEIRNPKTLEPLREISAQPATEGALILVAAYLGQTRLIDNWRLC